MKKLIPIAALGAVATIAPVAAAQGLPTTPAPQATVGSGFGAEPMQLIVSADRLFGVHFWSQHIEIDPIVGPLGVVIVPAQDVTNSGTGVNLLWGPSGDVNGISAIPRLGVDFVAGYHVTVGGSFGYMHRSSSTKSTQNNVSTETDNPSTSSWAFAPRVGYAFPLTDMLILWPRAGFAYYSYSQSQEQTTGAATSTVTTSADGFQLNLEPMLVFTPANHFGITVGFVADLPLSGSGKYETTTGATTTSYDIQTLTLRNFGFVSGILGYF